MTARRDRRTEILQTAARRFAVSGFHGVSIDDLGSDLGVSGPALYRYFPGKEAILAELLVDVSQRLLDGARRIADGPGSALDHLGALVAHHTDFALAEPDVIAVQFRDLDSAPDRERRTVRTLQRAYVRIWVEVLQQVYPAVSAERAQAAVQGVFGMLNSTPYMARAGEPRLADVLRRMAAAALAEACSRP